MHFFSPGCQRSSDTKHESKGVSDVIVDVNSQIDTMSLKYENSDMLKKDEIRFGLRHNGFWLKGIVCGSFFLVTDLTKMDP